ncbi:hypothetical protein VX159_07145 [Dechloromonas sp. ZY10]|uniref:hypothetical protein n=1 Tax=Dechloromonas aquae TaxID=2664436 RepID=UPI00352771DC
MQLHVAEILIEGIVMSKKIHFSLCFTAADKSDSIVFTGAAARNLLQALYGPEFCLQLSADGDNPSYELYDRQALTLMTSAGVIGAFLPETIRFSPSAISANGGLHIHHSVIDRLDESRERWKNTNELFQDEYGFGAPSPQLNEINQLLHFAWTHDSNDHAFAGVATWS